jgi:hypothetical protein
MALAPGYYIEEQLALQRLHGNNLYTGGDNLKIKADVQIATALGLRSKFPALRRVCNRMYADGLAMRLTLGRGDEKTGHFEGMSLTERAALCARVTYKLTRHRLKHRGRPTA